MLVRISVAPICVLDMLCMILGLFLVPLLRLEPRLPLSVFHYSRVLELVHCRLDTMIKNPIQKLKRSISGGGVSIYICLYIIYSPN